MCNVYKIIVQLNLCKCNEIVGWCMSSPTLTTGGSFLTASAFFVATSAFFLAASTFFLAGFFLLDDLSSSNSWSESESRRFVMADFPGSKNELQNYKSSNELLGNE